MPLIDEMDFLNAPGVERTQQAIEKAKDKAEKKKLINQIVTEVRDALSSVVIAKINDRVEVSNLDEVQAALRNELTRAIGPLVKKKVTKDKSIDRLNKTLDKLVDQEPLKELRVSNLSEIEIPRDVSVNNIDEVVKRIEDLNKTIKRIKVDPRIEVKPADVVNPEIDLKPILKSLDLNLNKLRTNHKGRPLAVRLSDGQNFIDRLTEAVEQQKIAFQGFSDNFRLKNSKNTIIDPATETTLQLILEAINAPTATGENKTYEDTSFTSGDSPFVIDFFGDTGRTSTDGYIIIDGTGDITGEVSRDGAVYDDAFTMKKNETFDLLRLSVNKLRLTHTGTDSAYRVFII